MTNLTKRHISRRALKYFGFSSLFIGALVSACSDGSSTPSNGGSSGSSSKGGSGGAAAGSPSGGAAGSSSNAGSMNKAGSGGAAGSVSMAGNGGTGGGSGGSGGSAGSAGSGGSGGMACAATDKCCDDPNKTDPGMCGCGIPDADTDKDLTLDCKDKCPNDPLKTTDAGMCGCGVVDHDSDPTDAGNVFDCKPGQYLEAEGGVLSHVDVTVTPIDDGAGGAGGAGDAGGAGPGDVTDLTGVFTIGNDAKASKGKYIESPAGFTSDFHAGPARATYTFDIADAKKYEIFARFYTPTFDNNKFWIKVDDGVWTQIAATTGEEWYWFAFAPPGKFDMPLQFDFTKATHTLVIASDSDGARIDRLYITPGNDVPMPNTSVCNPPPPHSIKAGDVCEKSCGQLGGTSCDAVLCAAKTKLPAYDCAVCCTL